MNKYFHVQTKEVFNFSNITLISTKILKNKPMSTV